jgi:hypothetical protein
MIGARPLPKRLPTVWPDEGHKLRKGWWFATIGQPVDGSPFPGDAGWIRARSLASLQRHAETVRRCGWYVSPHAQLALADDWSERRGAC